MNRSDINCDLHSCFLCKTCLKEWLPALEKHRKNLLFRKGEKIFSEGENVKGIFFLYRGKVKIHKQWGSGKQLILHFAKEGDIFGFRGLGNEKVYPVSATALEEVVVCFVTTSFFESTLKVNHELTYKLMKFYAGELQDAEKRMGSLFHSEVKGRVAESLLLLKDQFGENAEGFINISLTKQDLASYAGTTYETYSRMISELEKQKIIKQSGKYIGILKEAKLQKLVD
ncbi:MAG: Crp/Fnr family transcriptional regulator [Ginsengibacter sp.]